MMTSTELKSLISTFDGLNPMRYRHDLQDYFIFTEGVFAVITEAKATWLLNLLAYDVFLAVKRAAETDGFYLMQFSMKVDTSQKNAEAKLAFAGSDKLLMKFSIGSTSFPPGQWSFYIYPCLEGEKFYCEAILPSEY
jgi:hypothetical protein